MDTKELIDKPIQAAVPESLHNKILIEAKKNYENSVSRLVRSILTDYFLKYPKKGIESK